LKKSFFRFTNYKSLKAHENHAHANKIDSDYDDEEENEDSEDDSLKKLPSSSTTPMKADEKTQPKASCPICHKTFQRAFNAKTHMIRVRLDFFYFVHASNNFSSKYLGSRKDQEVCLPRLPKRLFDQFRFESTYGGSWRRQKFQM
jgi:hypothetical protein